MTAVLCTIGKRFNARDIITAAGMDAETMKLTQQFVDAFRQAGWQLPGTGFATGWGGAPLIGIVAVVHSAASVPPEVEAIANALQSTRFLDGPLNVAIDDKWPAGQFGLHVGIRP